MVITKENKVNAIKNQLIPDWKKMVNSPLDNAIERRKLSSNIGPKIKAIKKGAGGIFSSIMIKPTTPITSRTSTSKKLVETA